MAYPATWSEAREKLKELIRDADQRGSVTSKLLQQTEQQRLEYFKDEDNAVKAALLDLSGAGPAPVAPAASQHYVDKSGEWSRRLVDDILADLPKDTSSLPDLFQKGLGNRKLPVNDFLLGSVLDGDLLNKLETVKKTDAWVLASRVTAALLHEVAEVSDEISLAVHVDFVVFEVASTTAAAVVSSGLKRKRNQADATVTLSRKRPDFLLYSNDALLMKGEDKIEGGMAAAKEDLVDKLAGWSNLFHGKVNFLLCYGAAGTRIQFFAAPRGTSELINLTPEYDLSTMAGRMAALSAGLVCSAIIVRQLPLLPHKYVRTGMTFDRPEYGGQIRIEESYVQKVVKPKAAYENHYSEERLQLLQNVYAAARRCPYLVQADEGFPKSSRSYAYVVRTMPVGMRVADSLPQEKLQKVVWCICSALEHLHNHEFGHGDVRLKNVVETWECYILIDFEYAMELNEPPSIDPPYPQAWGPNGCFILKNGLYVAASDLYMLGLIMKDHFDRLDGEGRLLMEQLLQKHFSAIEEVLKQDWVRKGRCNPSNLRS